jgi:PLP-dependent transaminase
VEIPTRAPTRDVAALTERDLAHLIHPHCPPTVRERLIVARGEGCRIWDADGREYLDVTGGGLWANLVGLGRSELAEAAACELERTGFFCAFWDFSNEPAIELAERLTEITPDAINRVYFTCGGSEGIEVAIKIARMYHQMSGDGERDWILGRRQSYHGVGHGGSSATDFEWLREGQGPPLPHFTHLSPTWPYRIEPDVRGDVTDHLIDELERRIEEVGPGRIAAFLGEPIMGVGGLLVPPEDYWPRVAEVLRRHGILLMVDEVVTGFGRMGEWFAAQHYGVEPDVMVTAKGLTSGYFPFGAVLMSERVGERIAGGDDGFPLGYTYTAHVAGSAVALANLQIIEREGLRERAVELGARMRELLDPLADLPVVGEVRGAGLLAAIELVADKATREPMCDIHPVTDALREEYGLIVRAAMNASLVLSPSLVLSRPELECCAEAIGAVLERTTPEGTVR